LLTVHQKFGTRARLCVGALFSAVGVVVIIF
jgi:hypothetical protein